MTTKIGITGHQNLDDPTAWAWVKEEIHKILRKQKPPIIGITCLAAGADQIFAEKILEHHGGIFAVIPFERYEDVFSTPEAKESYCNLVRIAENVTVLPRLQTDEQSYYEAGKKVVDLSDFMIAVWNGKPAKGLGGTADIVHYAHTNNKRIFHINPSIKRTMEWAQKRYVE